VGWQRWLNYYRTKLTTVVRRADDELDRREAELEVDKAERPWLHTEGDAPSFDEAKARIEHDTGSAARVPPTPAPTPGDAEAAQKIAAFDLAKQQAAAEERLASIRASLDIDPPSK
jgi:hypothetical protein